MRRRIKISRVAKREIFLALGVFSFLLLFVPIFTYYYFAKDLKSKVAIMNNKDTGVELLTRDGKPFFMFYHARSHNYIPLSQIPLLTQEAVISSEDKNFYHHPGFSIRGIIRAAYIDLLHQNFSNGGSTITQQLVKNALLNSKKDFLRKYQELTLALEIERRYSKQEILEMYLNSVYFGEGAFGIENAAEVYFGKHARNLTVAEDGLLAGILPAPSELSPISGNRQAALARQKYVLQEMESQGYITAGQAEQAKKEKLHFVDKKTAINAIAPHFALMVLSELRQKYGEETISRSGFKVKTTLDPGLQREAEKAVSQHVQKLVSENASNGAAVVLDTQTGEILTMVGSTDWRNPQFGKMNMAITPRSVGSSFKPIVYAAAFKEHLITPATILKDVPTKFPGGYQPKDYDRKYRGNVTVRRALSNSLNIPAVEVMQEVGVPDALNMASRLGITSLGNDASQYGLSLVLGSGEVSLLQLTNVYATFATGGVLHTPISILQITDKNGKTIFHANTHGKRVLGSDTAFLITSILSDERARHEEFGNLLDTPEKAAVKTGTAEDYRDSLTLGYTPSVAVGVWVGNNNNAPMSGVAGSLGAAPIWKDILVYATRGRKETWYAPPSDIIELPLCGSGDLLLPLRASSRSARMEYFIRGTQPVRYCTLSATPSGEMTPTTSPSP